MSRMALGRVTFISYSFLSTIMLYPSLSFFWDWYMPEVVIHFHLKFYFLSVSKGGICGFHVDVPSAFSGGPPSPWLVTSTNRDAPWHQQCSWNPKFPLVELDGRFTLRWGGRFPIFFSWVSSPTHILHIHEQLAGRLINKPADWSAWLIAKDLSQLVDY